MSKYRLLSSLKLLNVSNTNVRNYALKSGLKIKWIRPEKIPCYKPEKSGDLEPLPKIDLTQIRPDFKDSKELQTANDTVKKLFTLEFAPKNEMIKIYKQQVMDRVRQHKYDMDSMGTKIAKWTGTIRAMQDLMERFPRNKQMKVMLKELIDRRKKFLKFLRAGDYKQFEWLIENLNIEYKPPPEKFIRVERKESLTKLTQEYCDRIRNERLEKYKEQLQAEKPAFLKEKIHSLEHIRQEQQACGADITVTQEEIDEAKKQLQDLLEKQTKVEE